MAKTGALLQAVRLPQGDYDTCNYCRDRAVAFALLTTDADLVPRPVTRMCRECLHRVAAKAVALLSDPALPDVRRVTKMVCGCEFTRIGAPFDWSYCDGTHKGSFECDHIECKCREYVPSRMPLAANQWPVCTCGHGAQDHG